MKISIRKASRKDFEKIFRLIVELAEFERLNPPDARAKKRLMNDSFGKNRKNNILVALLDDEIVGYAFYFYTYSSFLARSTLYLEDIYISASHRNKGIGKQLFAKLIETAKAQGCGRMEWCVLDWNTNAIKFYDNLGAKPLKDWIYYRKTLTPNPSPHGEGL
jgi:GNAT superfamily N-acetyltransferase